MFPKYRADRIQTNPDGVDGVAMGKWRFHGRFAGPCPGTVSSGGHSKMPQNRLLVPAVLASALLALVPLQLINEAQAPAAAGGARGGGRGFRDSRGLGTSFSGPHSDQLKLTERFTRIDPEMIDYRICVEDPAT